MNYSIEDHFQAIDILIDNKIKDQTFDKTITCEVIQKDKDNENVYLVSNGEIKFNASNQSSKSFRKGDQVYVLVQNGDFNLQKIIIGGYSAEESSEVDYYSGKNFVPVTREIFHGYGDSWDWAEHPEEAKVRIDTEAFTNDEVTLTVTSDGIPTSTDSPLAAITLNNSHKMYYETDDNGTLQDTFKIDFTPRETLRKYTPRFVKTQFDIITKGLIVGSIKDRTIRDNTGDYSLVMNVKNSSDGNLYTKEFNHFWGNKYGYMNDGFTINYTFEIPEEHWANAAKIEFTLKQDGNFLRSAPMGTISIKNLKAWIGINPTDQILPKEDFVLLAYPYDKKDFHVLENNGKTWPEVGDGVDRDFYAIPIIYDDEVKGFRMYEYKEKAGEYATYYGTRQLLPSIVTDGYPIWYRASVPEMNLGGDLSYTLASSTGEESNYYPELTEGRYWRYYGSGTLGEYKKFDFWCLREYSLETDKPIEENDMEILKPLSEKSGNLGYEADKLNTTYITPAGDEMLTETYQAYLTILSGEAASGLIKKRWAADCHVPSALMNKEKRGPDTTTDYTFEEKVEMYGHPYSLFKVVIPITKDDTTTYIKRIIWFDLKYWEEPPANPSSSVLSPQERLDMMQQQIDTLRNEIEGGNNL